MKTEPQKEHGWLQTLGYDPEQALYRDEGADDLRHNFNYALHAAESWWRVEWAGLGGTVQGLKYATIG